MDPEANIGIAVVGGGAWGSNHVRVWNRLGNLRMICEASGERRESFTGLPNRVKVVEGVEAALHDPEIDAVVIATPAATHYELARASIDAGKDVLIEKPMALSVEDAVEIQELAAQHQVVLSVGHVLEYHPAVTRLLELVREGVLGEIRYLYSNRLNLGRVRTEENALWSFAPHDIALMRRITGSVPSTVTCTGGAYLDPNVADVTLTGLDFAGSAMGHIFVSWLHPFKVHRFVLVGSEQMADFDDTAPWSEKLRLFAHQVEMSEGQPPVARRADAKPVTLDKREPLELECLHFLECVGTRATPLTDADSGVDVLRVLDAAQRSLGEGGVPTTLR